MVLCFWLVGLHTFREDGDGSTTLAATMRAEDSLTGLHGSVHRGTHRDVALLVKADAQSLLEEDQ
jgi:hypothetical protein